MLPTPRGLILLLLAAPLMALGAWLPAFEWLAWAYLGVAALLFGLDWRFSGPVTRFEARRLREPRLSLGAENPIRLEIHHRGPRPVEFQARDEAPEQFRIGTHILSGTVNPRETWRGLYHVRPLRRGDYQFGDLHLRWRSPLGLLFRQGRVPAAEQVKVFPNLLDVRRYDLLLRRNRLQEMGLRSSRMFGEGTEFERMREYLPDDEFRRINWKATARRRRPVTMEYQTERSQNVITVIDCGRMMQSPVADIAKLDYVVNASLFLSYVATGKGDRVGLLTFADFVMHYLSPQQGRGQFYRALELLYAIEPQPVEPNYTHALSYLALKQRRRSLIILFTDLTSGASMNTLVAQVSLLARSNLPLVVTISDPDIYAAAHQKPENSLGVYERAAAAQLLDERRLTLETLHRHGVMTLDVPANQLSIAVINRYLELKGKMAL